MKLNRIFGALGFAFAAGLVSVASADPMDDMLEGFSNDDAFTNRAAGCTDFSGKFKGNCTMGGKSAPHEVTVKQSGCEVVKLGHKALFIGGVQSLQAATAQRAASGTLAADWNKEKTIVSIRASGEYRDFADAAKSKNGAMTGTLRLDNGKQLVLTAKTAKGEATCTLDKQ